MTNNTKFKISESTVKNWVDNQPVRHKDFAVAIEEINKKLDSILNILNSKKE